MQVVNDRVLIEPKDKEEMTAGGIVLPDSQTDTPVEGVIVSVGNGRVLPNGERSKMIFETGQRVLFAKFAGAEVKHNGKEYLAVREEDVIAIIGERK